MMTDKITISMPCFECGKKVSVQSAVVNKTFKGKDFSLKTLPSGAHHLVEGKRAICNCGAEFIFLQKWTSHIEVMELQPDIRPNLQDEILAP